MKNLFRTIALSSVVVLLAACSGGSGGGTGPDASQDYNLKVSLTDMPMTNVKAVHVTVASVRVHQSADAGADAAGWQEIPVTAAMPVDMMTLRNGVLLELCRTTLSAGDYQQVRLVMTPNAGGGDASRNYVTTMDGATHPVDMPSDVKILHSFTVGSGQTDVTLDFVAADSMHQRGNGSYYMNPVIHPSSKMM
jgi:hypothetical protein